MKSKFLKIAGVKTEEEFYKMFPTEESFFLKHGKDLKKAQFGITSPINLPNTIDLSSGSNLLNGVDLKSKGSNMGSPINYSPIGVKINAYNQMESIGSTPIAVSDRAKNMPEIKIPNTSGFSLSKNALTKNVLGGLANSAGDIVSGISDIKQNKKILKQGQQYSTISRLAAQASSGRDKVDRKYVRPEDNLVTNLNPYGNGTNYLAAKNGKTLKKAEFGIDMFSGLAGNLGGLLGSKIQGGKSVGPGSKIGSSVLGGIGNLILPGVGGLVGSAVGGLAGSLIAGDGRIQKQIENNQQEIENNMLSQGIGSSLNGFTSFARHGGKIRSNQMFDGDLQIHRGDAEIISDNPYSEQTIKFKGPSHKNGGMPISFGKKGLVMNPDRDADVEVEGGETAMMVKDPNEEDKVVVFGALPISKNSAIEIGDKFSEGKTFKSYTDKIAKKENYQTEKLNKFSNLIDNSNSNNPFDKIAMNSANMMMLGSNLKLKDLAQKKMNAYLVQDAILRTAEEYGVKSEKLAKAKFGGKFTSSNIAQKGITLEHDDEFDDPNLGMYQILGEELTSDPEIDSYNNNIINVGDDNELITFQDDDEPVIIGNTINADDIVVSEDDEVENSPNIFRGNVNYKKITEPFSEYYPTIPFAKKDNNNYPTIPFAIKDDFDYTKNYFGDNPKVSKEGINRLKLHVPELIPTAPMKSMPSDLTNSNFKTENSLGVPLEEVSVKAKKLNGNDNFYRTDGYPITYGNNNNQEVKKDKKKLKINWPNVNKEDLMDFGLTAANAIQPFIRKDVNQPLDYTQLAPEMLAMAQNQLEPVKMQSYQPILNQAQNYNYQDQLNEVTAQSRAAEKLAMSNPAAASMLFAQVANAKNKILGEQFRVNQAERQRIAEQNSQVLNDAQLKNLALYDQQYARQEEAKSKTKAQNTEIFKSMADKIAKNKLSNLKQSVMQNMYPAFNFTKSGTVYKNPLYQTYFEGDELDAGDIYSAAIQNSSTNNKETKTSKTKTKSNTKDRNGGIVKAFKNF